MESELHRPQAGKGDLRHPPAEKSFHRPAAGLSGHAEISPELSAVPFPWICLLFCTLAGISHAISLWQLLAALAFPLHRRTDAGEFAPGITLLKPLKGADVHTLDCLRSWFCQDYTGPVQILFGVHTADDARRAVDVGANGVVVSNHVGRQLDGVPASEAAIIEFGRELFRDKRVSAATYARTLSVLGRQGLVHMTALMANYTMTAVIFAALDQQVAPDQEPLLPLPWRL